MGVSWGRGAGRSCARQKRIGAATMKMKRLRKNEARRIAANIAKLPGGW